MSDDDKTWALQLARHMGPALQALPYNVPHAHAHMLHTGPLHSHVAGRTDHLPSQVPNQSYVITADNVAHLGEDNTVSGFKVLKRMFEGAHRDYGGMPYGGGGGGPYGQGSAPYGGHAEGGKAEGSKGVPVAVAGGEHVLSPAEVAWAGMGDMEAGHRALDAVQLHWRKEHMDTLKKLKPPKRD